MSNINKEKIICISHKTFFTDLEDMLISSEKEMFHYKYVPVVIASIQNLRDKKPINEKQIKKYNYNNYFYLFEDNTPISTLIEYFGNITKEDFTLAKKTYNKLYEFAVQCSERIISDLCVSVILDALNEEEDQKCRYFFFIEKPLSDKMLGRLGYLGLDLSETTICFISYEPEDMITTIISSKTGKINFDFNQLIINKNEYYDFGPYPGSSDESIFLTYFIKPHSIGKKDFLPLRLDIFCQGLLNHDIKNKKDECMEIFNNDQLCLPHSLLNNELSPFVKIPIGLIDVQKYWNSKVMNKKNIFKEIAMKEKQI